MELIWYNMNVGRTDHRRSRVTMDSIKITLDPGPWTVPAARRRPGLAGAAQTPWNSLGSISVVSSYCLA